MGFYSDTQAIQSFKDYIRELVEHENTITGIKLKDEPTILVWETGSNLVGAPAAWTTEISRFLKEELGIKQLIVDGCNMDTRSSEVVHSEHVDIVSTSSLSVDDPEPSV